MHRALVTILTLAASAGAQVHPDQPAPATPDPLRIHRVHLATSADGLEFSEQRSPLLARADAPEVIVLSGAGQAGGAGNIVVLAIDRSDPRREQLVRLASTDSGRTWSAPQPVTLRGWPEDAAPADPAIVQLDDGRLRLFLVAVPTSQERQPRDRLPDRPRDIELPKPDRPVQPIPRDPRQPGPPTRIDPPPDEPKAAPGSIRVLSAISDDGITFTVEEGTRVATPDVSDPDVLHAGDQWLMFLSRGDEVLLARSSDGLRFRMDDAFLMGAGGSPSAVPLADGTVRLYQSGREGIISAIFDPEASTLRREPGLRVKGPCADPAVYLRPEGGCVIAFTRFDKDD